MEHRDKQMKKVIEFLGILAVLFLIILAVSQTIMLVGCKSTEERVGELAICEMMKNSFIYNQNSSCEDD